ncbi:[acyl-carrier-protein] S-malonyltransferase [Saccharomonospora amisosensis]|uniref:[acyl-carrier-protein] S-malonyltransferase n=1 Tax=Saccharomonospora amisosensis TaxID=1128677 RepID=A0A7X5URS1_9PSEU|nr:ACP S-malonyltransferase [Saccharomonospora amisosensis]NIJ12995.1 [acyl-carrier-protein] S-malonyltransferase [Saccharomonospora amisosensis]
MLGSGTELPGVAFAGQGMRPQVVLSSLSRHGTQPLVAELLEMLRVRALPALDFTDTRAAQPAIYVAGLVAALARLGPAAEVPLVTGHSLGELAALAYAGVISPEDGLRLAAARGRLCRAVQLERPGAMAAVVGLEPAAVELLRRQVIGESAGVLEVAAVNARRQVVLSGDRASVLLAIKHAEATAARVVTLPIDGAFHSPLMVGALPGWRTALRATEFAPGRTTVVSSVDGEPHDDPADLRELLAKALVLPVRWTEVMETVARLGVQELWDAGPGTILRGLARRGGPVEFVEPVPAPTVGPGGSADQPLPAGEGDQVLA